MKIKILTALIVLACFANCKSAKVDKQTPTTDNSEHAGHGTIFGVSINIFHHRSPEEKGKAARKRRKEK
jgi:hypothetical protein